MSHMHIYIRRLTEPLFICLGFSYRHSNPQSHSLALDPELDLLVMAGQDFDWVTFTPEAIEERHSASTGAYVSQVKSISC